MGESSEHRDSESNFSYVGEGIERPGRLRVLRQWLIHRVVNLSPFRAWRRHAAGRRRIDSDAVVEARVWVGGDAGTAGLVRAILGEGGHRVSEVGGDVGGLSPDLGFAGGYYVFVMGTEAEIRSARQVVEDFHGS